MGVSPCCLSCSKHNFFVFSLFLQNSRIWLLNVKWVHTVCYTSCPGLSALQLASVTLKSIVGDLEKSVTMSQARVHSLRKEQMMETLKCLLQMECNLQCLVSKDWVALCHMCQLPNLNIHLGICMILFFLSCTEMKKLCCVACDCPVFLVN